MKKDNFARKFTREFLSRAIAMLENGKTLTETAQELGCSHSALSISLNEAGLRPTRQYGVKLPTNEIVAMYADGMGAPEIGREFGVSRSVVRRQLLAAGVKMRTQGDAAIMQRVRKLVYSKE